MLEWANDERCRRVVDDQWNTEAAANGGDLGDGEDLELRVGQRLGVVGAGAIVRRARKSFRIGRIDERVSMPKLLSVAANSAQVPP